ncbi:hypothetical protein [Lutimonas sp.]|uniref:hypothetical protein n=1 Tax=Lutimonas sp. TaxID=1872403 RepID=UPI003D9AD3CB
MKNFTRFMIVVALFFMSVKSSAQDKDNVPKELLLSSLNSVGKLKLDNDQITKIIDYNSGFVDEVYKILDSEKEDKYKKKSLQALHLTRETDLKELIGKSKTKKYLKLMEDELRPLVKKDHRLKPIAKS